MRARDIGAEFTVTGEPLVEAERVPAGVIEPTRAWSRSSGIPKARPRRPPGPTSGSVAAPELEVAVKERLDAEVAIPIRYRVASGPEG